MSTARGRLWRRLVESGRWDKQTILDKLGSQPNKQDALDACEALGIAVPEKATVAELLELLRNA